MRLLIALLIMVVAQVALAEEARRLTLEDVKRFAIANNFGIEAAQAAVEETKAQTQQKRSGFFPKLSAVAGPELRSEENRSRAETLAYLEGKWNIFRGSEDRIGLELSTLNEKIAESAKRSAQFELELEIERFFYAYLTSVSKIGLYEKSLALNEKHRQLLRRKQSAGMASQADLMEFELRDSYLRSAISSFEQEKVEARLGLVRLMGPKVGTNFIPSGEVPHVHLKQPLAEFLSRINSTSENVKIASLQAASGAVAAKAARSGWLPTVDLETKYGKLSQDLAQTSPAFDGILVFRWEFFSGFETRGKIAEASARAKRLENEFRQKLLITMTEAEVNYLKLKSIQERVHVEEGNEAKALSYYNAVVSEYTRGLKNGADLKNAEAVLLEARMRANDFKYQFIDNKISLEKAIGLFVETQSH